MLGIAVMAALGFWWYGYRIDKLEKRLERLTQEMRADRFR